MQQQQQNSSFDFYEEDDMLTNKKPADTGGKLADRNRMYFQYNNNSNDGRSYNDQFDTIHQIDPASQPKTVH